MVFISAVHHTSYTQAGGPRQEDGACFPAAFESRLPTAKASSSNFSITPQDRAEAKRRCDDHKAGQPQDRSIASWLSWAAEFVAGSPPSCR